MLGDLARWLRAAGYDTRLANVGSSDDDLLLLAQLERRILLTQDRRLAERKAGAARIFRLKAQDLDGRARELKATLGLDWVLAPFTRCMIDNTPLRDLEGPELDHLPSSARRLPGPFRICPSCDRRYWPGSHAKRISGRLEAWAGAP